MKPQPTQVILTASASLIGICFFVLTNLIKLDALDRSHIDEAATISLCFFLCSCYSAYLALRSKNDKKTVKIEKFADTFFLMGLTIISVSAILFALKIMS
jgi:cbb3-type cytochrome oxidase subunit 3